MLPVDDILFNSFESFSSINGNKLKIEGDLSLSNNLPTFSGKGSFDIFGSGQIPNFSMSLVNPQGNKLKCHNVNVTKNNSNREFSAVIGRGELSVGQISSNDKVRVYDVVISKPFFGPNKLHKITPSTILYNDKINTIPDSSGYLHSEILFKQIRSYNKKLDRFYNLFSFATADFVGLPYQLIYKDKNNYIVNLSYPNISNGGSGIFYLDYPRIVENFINLAWSKYPKYEKKIDLPVLLNYYVLIENQKFVDSKILLSSVWMEAIKHNYAKNICNYSTNRGGFFLKPGSTSARFSFSELVSEVYSYFNVTNGDLTFVPYRNEVVHQGKLGINFGDKYNHLLLLLTSIEKILLNVFGYKGLILNRCNGEWEEY